MTSLPIVVQADDFTGAAELAGIAHEQGLAVHVSTRPATAFAGQVVVLDTDSRLLAPRAAARRVATFLKKLPRDGEVHLFKKTDSVLRGPVLAEIKTCADFLGRTDTLLLPANPSLGRTIRSGHYFVHDIPLHQTPFARDPHHPRLTSDVHHLLSGKPTPHVTVGDASSVRDLLQWVKRLGPDTLPAGGADFFRLWLKKIATSSRPRRDRHPRPPGPTLVVSGTSFPLSRQLAKLACHLPLPAGTDLGARLKSEDFAIVAAPATRLPETKQLPATFSRLVADLHRDGCFRHLVIAGGATAAAVLDRLGWSQLRVIHVWEPGVVTLQPAGSPCLVTLKPGSYAWPAALLRCVFS